MTVAMNCWEVLGLEPDADLRTVKRRYAQLLKQNHPDDDPGAFQHLREAYEQAINSSRSDSSVITPAKQSTVAVTHGTEWQRAAQLLEGLTLGGLDEAQAKAINAECGGAFEEQLLERCLESTPLAESLTDWALEHLHWLTPWQRPDLPQRSTQRLLDLVFARTEKSLEEQLRTGNDPQFCQHVYVLSLAPWLQALERRERFNHLLAAMLLGNDYWSCEVFSAVCKMQDWEDDGTFEQRCPPLYWSRLQERNNAQIFLEDQQRLALQTDLTPRSRAARLLLTPMSSEQRRQFTRYFLKDDWTACENLSETLREQYPRLYGQVPAAMPTIWRALKKRYGPGLISYVQLENLKSIGLVLLIILAMLVPAFYFNAQMVGRNQGLQPFPVRLCSGVPVRVEHCRLPETNAQWYPKIQAIEK